jgi:hypothetical protein
MVASAPAVAVLLALAANPAPDESPLTAAEAKLLDGDAKAALALLAGAGSTPRRLRLEADARVALGDRDAPSYLEALAKHPGWEQHAMRQTMLLEEEKARQDRVRLGSILFALTLGLLILTGARELLVVRIEVLVAGIGAAAALLIWAELSKPLMTVAGVVAMAGVALVHAGTAAVRRTAAEPRVRAMIAASMLLGFAGAVWAVGTQIGWGGLVLVLSSASTGG